MINLYQYLKAVTMIVMIEQLVTTPEQRALWAKQYDWNHYASRYVD